jgi:membrane fusion protein, multidrug efflux system
MSPAVADERGKRVAGRVVGLLIVVAAAGLSLYVYRDLFVHPRTDDAYVRANVVGIAPHVSGPIVELKISDNQFVRAGELLFVVDPRPYEAAAEKAQADLELTELEIQAHEHTVAAAEAGLDRRIADDAYQRDYLERVVPLLSKQFVTADQVALARSRVEASAADVAQARADLVRARNLLGQVGDVNARRQAARAELRRAELDVGYCSVRAPFDGWVTNLNIAVGQYANRGKEVFALVDDGAWYVMANFRETFLESIRPGDPAEVYLLAYPGRRFRGVVQGIGWALYQRDGATIGGLPSIEPTLNWVRLAQRFPVRIALEDRDPERPFRMGATAVVTIHPKS